MTKASFPAANKDISESFPSEHAASRRTWSRSGIADVAREVPLVVVVPRRGIDSRSKREICLSACMVIRRSAKFGAPCSAGKGSKAIGRARKARITRCDVPREELPHVCGDGESTEGESRDDDPARELANTHKERSMQSSQAGFFLVKRTKVNHDRDGVPRSAGREARETEARSRETVSRRLHPPW
jgi:hypothetical protein